ncbi:sulfur carrier protein FdhD [Rubritalea halochordaticola]|uniref:Sulfur carrier protein FdhD n=1 Tax=Rubritalea halochordaticola TaxID=714537 RepID=A0ABP9UXW9_9BACT
MSEERSAEYQVQRAGELVSDRLAVEEPMQITVDGCPIAVVMRTPGHDEDLVRGFLLTEGVLRSLSLVSRIDLEQKQNHALVFLNDDAEVDYEKQQRNLYSASSCGICGKASIESIRQELPRLESGFAVRKEILLALPDKMRETQETFEKTGGLHAAALFTQDGELVVLREDVGRHNAIDKVIGWAAAEEIDFSHLILQVSGRVSFEVMQKSHAVGIPVISAISAPTSLAVDFAQESGQTLIGFLRPPSYNVYSGEVV